MHARPTTDSVLEKVQVPVPLRLAALWVGVMFIYAYVDILGFYKPGVIEDILAGRVWQLQITQTWAFGALALMTVPILMVFLSTALPARANRRTNIIVAALYVVISVGNAIDESWLYYHSFAVAVEVLLLVLVIRFAWTWPLTQSDADPVNARQPVAATVGQDPA